MLMNSVTKRLVPALIALLLVFLLAVPAFAVEDGLADPEGPIIGISAGGLWTKYPQNALEGLLAVRQTGLKYVLADVSRTSDGVLILLPEDAAGRMLGTEEPTVSAQKSDALLSLPMKNRMGGTANGTTAYRVSTLKDALPALKDAGLTPVLRFDAALCADVDAIGDGTAVWFVTGKEKDVKAAAAAYAKTHPFLAGLRSNVIFHVSSFIADMKEAGAVGVNLRTTNRYGVVFYRSTLKKCDTLRAVADCSDPETAGARADSVKWWDDLVSRGYSVIITDDPEGFGQYLDENESARARLQTLYDYVKNEAKIPEFNGEKLNDYKKAYNDGVTAAETLLADSSSSLQDMRDAYTKLSAAMKDIELHYEELEAGTAGKTVTVPRVLLCVAFAAAVVAVQVYFFKRRKA